MKRVLLLIYLCFSVSATAVETKNELFATSFLRDAEWFISLLDSDTLEPEIERDVIVITYKRLFMVWFYDQENAFESVNKQYVSYLLSRFRKLGSRIDEDILEKLDPLAILSAYDPDGSLSARIPIKEASLLFHLKDRKAYQLLVQRFLSETQLFAEGKPAEK